MPYVVSVETISVPLGWNRRAPGPRNPAQTRTVKAILADVDRITQQIQRNVNELNQTIGNAAPLSEQPGQAKQEDTGR